MSNQLLSRIPATSRAVVTNINCINPDHKRLRNQQCKLITYKNAKNHDQYICIGTLPDANGHGEVPCPFTKVFGANKLLKCRLQQKVIVKMYELKLEYNFYINLILQLALPRMSSSFYIQENQEQAFLNSYQALLHQAITEVPAVSSVVEVSPSTSVIAGQPVADVLKTNSIPTNGPAAQISMELSFETNDSNFSIKKRKITEETASISASSINESMRSLTFDSSTK